MSEKKYALILTDTKAGHENQSKALARMLGLEAKLVTVEYHGKIAKGLSYVLSHLRIYAGWLFHLSAKGMRKVNPAEVAVVLGTGSGTFYPVAVVAKKFGVKSGVVLYPRGYNMKMFDCIIAPRFDQPAEEINIISVPANLVANDASYYDAGVETFRGKHAVKEGVNAAAVVIGGPNKCSTMTKEWMKGELDKIFAAREEGQELWVTTSRRTPADVEALVDTYPWDYKLIYSVDHYNPIPAFVKLCKKLYVTAESTGMVSEAVTCGEAEVEVLDNLVGGEHKFRMFVNTLRSHGYIGGKKKVDIARKMERAKKLLLGDEG